MNHKLVPLIVAVSVGFGLWWVCGVSSNHESLGVSASSPRAGKNLQAAARQALRPQSLENRDSRVAHRPPSNLSDQQQLALAELRREVPDVQVEFDAITGSPRHVMSNSRFLTQSEPVPRLLSYAQAEAKVKAYVNTHKALFLHGGELLDEAKVARRDTTATTGLQTLAWQQEAEGLPVFESFFKANLSKSGEIIMVASELMADADAAVSNYLAAHPQTGATPAITVETAVSLAAANVGATVPPSQVAAIASPNPKLAYQFFRVQDKSDAYAQKVWVPMDATTVRLGWEVTVKGANADMFTVVVDANSGEALLRQSRTAADAVPQYRVYTGDSPTPMSPGFSSYDLATTQPPVVSRQLVQIQSLNATASPSGWIGAGGSTTIGNNVDAYADKDDDELADPGSRPVGTGVDSRTFDFPLDLTQDPSTHTPASVVQLFYTNNWVHDQLYSLGFTESSGNFQTSNFGRNGATATDEGDNDPVNAEAQDSINNPVDPEGKNRNNAYFFTPHDGIRPRMQMFIWNGPTPARDGSIDQEIVVHEYGHGLSNRLVAAGRAAMVNRQSIGMGEGWSDFYAQSLLSEAGDDPHGIYPMAPYSLYQNIYGYSSNYYYGLRRYPKTTDMSKNPLTFKDIDPDQASKHAGIPRNPSSSIPAVDQQHNMGEVWSSMLWEARVRMIDRYGWGTGNQEILQIVTDGLKLTPADPNFIQARDAILQADANRGSTYRSILWNAFAKRGLGVGATSPDSSTTVDLVENFNVPPDVDVSAPVVTFTPLSNNLSVSGFTDVGPQAIGGTINEECGVSFSIEESNTGSPVRFWNGGGWSATRTRLRAITVGNTWKPAPDVVLPDNTELRNGYYRVFVHAADNGGNATEVAITLTRDPGADVVAPVAQINNPLHNATIAGFHSLTGTASDPEGGSGLTGAVAITIMANNQYWTGTGWSINPATVSANMSNDGTWSCPLLPAGPHVRSGVHTARVVAYDWAGNTSASVTGTNFIMFTVTPSLDAIEPTVQITSPGSLGTPKVAVNEIAGTAADTGGSGLLRLVTIKIEQAGDHWDGTTWSSSTYTYVLPIAEDGTWRFGQMPAQSQVRSGLHTVTASVYDYGGNTTQAQVSYTIDATAPTGQITAPADQSHHANFPAFSGTAMDANGIQSVALFIRRARDSSYWNGATWGQKPTALSSNYNSGNHTFTGNFPLPNAGVNSVGGVYYYDAIATDTAGNYYQFGSTITVDYYAIYQWTGTSINANNLWDDPANWYSTSAVAFVPGPDDVVVINSGTPRTFTGQNISVRELRLNGGVLTAGNLHVSTALKMTGGTFTGGLHLENGSSSEWKAGRLIGQFTIAAGATLFLPVSGEGSKYLGAPDSPVTLNNSGTIVWSSNYPMQGQGGAGSEATINNLTTGVFDIARDGDPLDYFSSTIGLNFNNSGRVVKSAGTGISSLFNNWMFTCEPGAVIHCNVSGARLQRASNYATLWKNGTIFRGPGVIGLNGGIITAEVGSWTVEANAEWNLAGATLACPAVGTLTTLTLNPTSGSTLNWTAGRVQGSLTIPVGATLALPSLASGSKYLGSAGVRGAIYNAGTIVWASPYPIQGHGGVGSEATINNLATGVFDIAQDGDPLDYFSSTIGLIFNNSGLVVKSAGAGISNLFASWTLINEPGAIIHNSVAGSRLQRASNLATLWKSGTILRGPGIIGLNGGTITAESGSWTIEGGAQWELAGTTLACPEVGNGTLTLNPTSGSVLSWTSGRIQGSFTIPSGTTLLLALAGSSTKYLGADGLPGVIHNNGTIISSSPYPIVGHGGAGSGATINNLATGVFDIAQDGDPSDYAASTSELFFNNSGRVVKSAGTGISSLFNYWAFTNEPGAVIHNSVASSRLQRGSSLPTLWKSGTVFRGPGTIGLNYGAITATPGTWTIEGNALWDFAGGTLECPQSGELIISPATGSSLQWNGGILQGNLTIPVGVTLAMPATGSPKTMGATGFHATLNIAGTLRWLGGNSIRGHGDVAAGAAINIADTGIFDIAADGYPLDSTGGGSTLNLNNSGSIRKTAGTGTTSLNAIWTLNNASQLHASTGILDLSGNAYLNPGSSFQTLGSGQCCISNGLTTVNAMVNIGGTSPLLFSGGTITGSSNGLGAFNGGILDWTGGTISGILAFGVNLQANLTGNGTKYLASAATLNNSGVISWTAGSLWGHGSSTLANLAGGICNAPASASFDYSSGGNAFVNAGTLNIGSGAGSVSLPVAWSFSQTGTGKLNVDIGGTSTSDYDRILCGGSASLGGTVNITYLNSFAPPLDSVFTIMTYASHTGAFATVSSAGAFLSRDYTASNFTLTAVSAPSTYAAWKDIYFGAGSSEAGDSMDPDHDGVSNLLEYATGSNPTVHSALNTPITHPSAGTVTFTYNRSVAAKSQAVFQVIWKDDLAPASWSSVGVTETIISETNGVEQVRATIPAGSSGRRFFRLSVTPNP